MWREQCEIDLKVQFFSILLPMFGIRGAIWSSEKCKRGVLMFQGQIGEIRCGSKTLVIRRIKRNFILLSPSELRSDFLFI